MRHIVKPGEGRRGTTIHHSHATRQIAETKLHARHLALQALDGGGEGIEHVRRDDCHGWRRWRLGWDDGARGSERQRYYSGGDE